MPWIELFIVFVVSHLVGDFLLQTEWQARNKHGGLRTGTPEARRALVAHVCTYTLAFAPVLAVADLGVKLAWAVPAIALPHLLQDDGRLIYAYMRRVKGSEPAANLWVTIAVDQTFHLLALLGLALLIDS